MKPDTDIYKKLSRFEEQATTHLSGDLIKVTGKATAETLLAASDAARLTMTAARLHAMAGMEACWPEMGTLFLRNVTSLLDVLAQFGEQADKSIIGRHAKTFTEFADELVRRRVIERQP